MRLGLHPISEPVVDESPSKSIRRQLPLVNAGYALQVASLSRMVYEFIHCHTGSDQKPITLQTSVIIIGCGFDVMDL